MTANIGKPRLLSGGNPQIPKGYDEAPVRAYIGAVPGWKQRIVRQVDGIVSSTVPDVLKAVKWNSPLYGVEEGLWFLSIHCFTHYVKVAFFRGADLLPVPPGLSKQDNLRYLNIPESGMDAAQFADWVAQASALPGVKM